METTATSVLIAGDSFRVLTDLAAKLGQSEARVIEIALKDFDERMFWREADEAFQRTADDPVENGRRKVEIRMWEEGTAGDYKNEDW